MNTNLTRRQFLNSTTIAAAGLTLAGPTVSSAYGGAEKPAKLGGKPLCSSFPGWPVFDQTEEKALLDTLHTGQWFRGSGKAVAKFEHAYQKMTGARHCLATAS